ncbi:hypothetical protein L1285_16875 [Pseudoalteromonas sp. DL2-H2.2]|uniref:hypothetical protein n=1 Tax=Pseudoalteromonas sp. DL2-H2.2 TaxID=2908889 RepID=UPI001F3F882B|nr:hypothetical protein [Pseudoalteromonas sp. DL2-H2.2]MCF2909996.1 hypothetical protein [Pseudoalteromonas sp. DL2-H2.2]
MGLYHSIANDTPAQWVDAVSAVDLVTGASVQYVGEPVFNGSALVTTHETGYIELSVNSGIVAIEVWCRPHAQGVATAIITGADLVLGVSPTGGLVLNGTESSAQVSYDIDNQLVIQFGSETRVYLNGTAVTEFTSPANLIPAGQTVQLGVQVLASGRIHNCQLHRVVTYGHLLAGTSFGRTVSDQRLPFTSYATLNDLRADYHVIGDLTLSAQDGLTTTSAGYIESQWLEPGQALIMLDHIQADTLVADKIEFRDDLTVYAFGELVDLTVDASSILQVRFDDQMRLYLFRSDTDYQVFDRTAGRYSLKTYLALSPDNPVATLPLTTMYGDAQLVAPVVPKFRGVKLGLPIWANAETREQANPYGYDIRYLSDSYEPTLVHRSTNTQLLNVQQGYISDRVTINGLAAPDRRVLCYLQYGDLVAETRTDEQGNYRFDNLFADHRYMIVAQDKPEFGEAEYNAVAADYQQPTEYA